MFIDRIYLLRNVYDHMILDGVKPEKDTFSMLIGDSMKGVCLHICFFLHVQMKSTVLIPHVGVPYGTLKFILVCFM